MKVARTYSGFELPISSGFIQLRGDKHCESASIGMAEDERSSVTHFRKLEDVEEATGKVEKDL